MSKMKPPPVPESPVAVLSEEELARLIKACSGRGFDELRDTAIIRLLMDTGMRRGELIKLRLDDVDLDDQVAYVVGKGARPRACPLGAKTVQAIDRYLRKRNGHPHAASPALWLGVKGGLTVSGVAHRA